MPPRYLPLPWGVAAATLLLLLADHTAYAQSATSAWSAIQEVVMPGTKLSIDLNRGRLIEGRFVGISEAKLTVSSGRQTVDVERTEVARVYRHVPRSKKKDILIGAAVAGALGAAIGTGLVA